MRPAQFALVATIAITLTKAQTCTDLITNNCPSTQGQSCINCALALGTTQLAGVGCSGGLVQQLCTAGIPANNVIKAPTAPTPNPTPAPTIPASNLCDPAQPTCCDTVDNCDHFVKAGSCGPASPAIKLICARSCNLCTNAPVCSQTNFDCYPHQLACANQLTAQGVTVTQDGLISCVRPIALALPAQDCCKKFVTYRSYCALPINVPKCECQSYDHYFAYVADPTNCVQGTVQKTVRVGLHIVRFTNLVDCQDSKPRSGMSVVEALPSYIGDDTAIFNFESCEPHPQNPNIFLFFQCGVTPGNVAVSSYTDNQCTIQTGVHYNLVDGMCQLAIAGSLVSGFSQGQFYDKPLFTVPPKCGTNPNVVPTEMPTTAITTTKCSDWTSMFKQGLISQLQLESGCNSNVNCRMKKKKKCKQRKKKQCHKINDYQHCLDAGCTPKMQRHVVGVRSFRRCAN